MITLLRWLRPLQALAILTLLITGVQLARTRDPEPQAPLLVARTAPARSSRAALSDQAAHASAEPETASAGARHAPDDKSEMNSRNDQGDQDDQSGGDRPRAGRLSELDEIARAANLLGRNTGLLTARPSRRTIRLTRWTEVIEALTHNRLIRRGSYGELEQLIPLAERLRSYREMSLKSKGSRREFLALIDWNHGDMRRLTAFLHWYLCTAWKHCRDREPDLPGELEIELWPHELKPLPETRVKALRDLDHDTLLGLLD